MPAAPVIALIIVSTILVVSWGLWLRWLHRWKRDDAIKKHHVTVHISEDTKHFLVHLWRHK